MVGSYGGAVYSTGVTSEVRMVSCYFWANDADDEYGGAVCCSEGTAELDNCVFIQNVARENGGAYADAGSQVASS